MILLSISYLTCRFEHRNVRNKYLTNVNNNILNTLLKFNITTPFSCENCRIFPIKLGHIKRH